MAAAAKIKAAGASQCAYTTGWPSWVHVENFSAWHNVPIGTKENGMGGLDTTFQINSPLHVQHWNNLKDWSQQGLLHLRRPPQRRRRPSSTAASARC